MTANHYHNHCFKGAGMTFQHLCFLSTGLQQWQGDQEPDAKYNCRTGLKMSEQLRGLHSRYIGADTVLASNQSYRVSNLQQSRHSVLPAQPLAD